MSTSETPRAVPFYCPFCGEQDIRPAEPTGYRCRVCERTWELSLVAVGPEPEAADETEREEANR